MATLKIQQPVSNTPVNTKKSPMELLIAQQAMAQKADANTMVGFALGKLLRGLFDDWKERYDARGTLNRMAEMDPNKRNEILAFLEKYNPPQHQRMQEYLAKNNGTWDGWNNSPQNTAAPTIQTPQQDNSGVNSNARAVQQTTANLLGDTDFWTQRTQMTNTDDDWNKWRNLFNGVGWQNGLRF